MFTHYTFLALDLAMPSEPPRPIDTAWRRPPGPSATR